jgi:hypothetical protein
VTGFSFYAEKDKAMANHADYGFMIWNGESKGTLNNIINLAKQSKPVAVYFTPLQKFCYVKTMEDAQKLISHSGDKTRLLFHTLSGESAKSYATNRNAEQVSLY